MHVENHTLGISYLQKHHCPIGTCTPVDIKVYRELVCNRIWVTTWSRKSFLILPNKAPKYSKNRSVYGCRKHKMYPVAHKVTPYLKSYHIIFYRHSCVLDTSFYEHLIISIPVVSAQCAVCPLQLLQSYLFPICMIPMAYRWEIVETPAWSKRLLGDGLRQGTRRCLSPLV